MLISRPTWFMTSTITCSTIVYNGQDLQPA
ncbi:hypothetical protein MANES_17G026498v8 [Manihot esculenta]|uniref:Uncharacterized protein n=1 Tax=Manihot esculenta TaxID=3983 RepID=A0ACB7G2R4_MANES|nr:hypothetical protein MANES_17G026498v8 [Manihot esculenta]